MSKVNNAQQFPFVRLRAARAAFVAVVSRAERFSLASRKFAREIYYRCMRRRKFIPISVLAAKHKVRHIRASCVTFKVEQLPNINHFSSHVSLSYVATIRRANKRLVKSV